MFGKKFDRFQNKENIMTKGIAVGVDCKIKSTRLNNVSMSSLSVFVKIRAAFKPLFVQLNCPIQLCTDFDMEVLQILFEELDDRFDWSKGKISCEVDNLGGISTTGVCIGVVENNCLFVSSSFGFDGVKLSTTILESDISVFRSLFTSLLLRGTYGYITRKVHMSFIKLFEKGIEEEKEEYKEIDLDFEN
ncbi:hypothetical protein AGLY_015890 [Aphis glycines]|uniref:Uncharacterized protein n=1 Tax=Aphis glycines TaxID=307491 RepID=A0A6G0SZI8_APHGL|nr:hypothetical protein AGLY_015890 [Aphis glycines]